MTRTVPRPVQVELVVLSTITQSQPVKLDSQYRVEF